jgi:two-component system OmpR family response regulator
VRGGDLRILLIDDEEDFANPLAEGLRREGYPVEIAYDSAEAIFMFEVYPYDLVLLDLNLPDQDGLLLCDEFRRVNPEILICIISARGRVSERIEGLNQGADEYLTKPVHFQELIAHVRALVRRNLYLRKPLVEIGQLVLDTNLRRVFVSNQEIKLTAKEYQLIECLVSNIGRTVSQVELIMHIWGEEDALFSNSVRTHICTLRKKLKKAGVKNPALLTKVNQGYSLIIDEIPE